MNLRTIGTYGSVAIGVLVAAAMSGSTALAQEPAEADATKEIIVTGISVVGHIVVEPDNDNDGSLNAIPAQAECEMPKLYLAPRAAVILQHVFSAVAIESPPSEFPDRAKSFAIESLPRAASTLSTVAGDASQIGWSGLTDPASGSEDVETVQDFQWKMFRTDI